MQVIKRDGRVQSLDVIKIRSSILGASIDSDTIINEADLKVLSTSVLKILKDLRGDDGITSTYEIFAVIIETLNVDGFYDIAMSYLGYKNCDR
ncbi:ATP cone domain-containing protein [uncultured Clostridium sp.]|uniref:ATP cone domain-containing protein n=1 Tax=uncultured Clostridium sp. TaxID=59620 RepID=UPI00262FEDBB|nr:ATP cone domain-containing protein [uncultured Clostridium sp.]